MKRIALAISLLIIGVFVITGCGENQQSGLSFYSVSGHVREVGTSNPIPNLKIRFNGSFGEVTTDANGFWKKDKLYGTVVISPEITGWYFDKWSVRTQNKGNNNIDFNGTKLRFVFQSTRPPNSSFNIYFRNGLEDIPLTTIYHNACPDLAHLTSKVLFMSSGRPDSEGQHHIFVINTNGTGLTKLTFIDSFNPDWSYDDSKIVYDAGGFLYTMNSDGSNQTVIPGSVSGDRTPSWSPDGIHIAFCSGPNGDELYTMNINGTERNQLISNYCGDPAWSPDGSKIAFSSGRDGSSEIYVMDANGENQRRLTYDCISSGHPSWTPDGTKIIYASVSFIANDHNRIYIIDAVDGTHRTQLTFSDGYEYVPSSYKFR